MKTKWLVVGIILLFVGVTIAPAMAQNTEKQSSRGNWLYVGGNGPGNYTKIQDAINAASDGDIIIIYNKTYREDILVNKQVSLLGIDLPTVIAYDFYVFSLVANNCVIDNFRLPDTDNALYINSHYNIIKNCSITSYVVLENASFNHVVNNRINMEGIEARSSSNNNNFSSNNISYTETPRNRYGIEISSSKNNMIFNNILYDDWRGVYLTSTINTTILRNHFYWCGITIDGTLMSHFSTHTIQENLLGTEPLKFYYYINQTSVDVPSDAGQVYLINCSHSRIRNLNVPGFDNCLNLYFCSDTIITNCSIGGVPYCIYLYNSSSNRISNNTIGHKYAIYLDQSHNNIIDNNSFSDAAVYLHVANDNEILFNTLNDCNIRVGGDRNIINDNVINLGSIHLGGMLNSITNNIIRDTDHGIEMAGGGNLVSGNEISSCTEYGMYDSGAGNIIRQNTFEKNTLAIQLYTTHDIITRNKIIENQQGISIIGGSRNLIMNNNFILNILDARFEESLFNHWINNYWGRPMVKPKIIPGKLTFYEPFTGEFIFSTPWFNFDFRPRLLPVIIT